MTPFDSHAYTEAYVSFTADTLADYIPEYKELPFLVIKISTKELLPCGRHKPGKSKCLA